MSRRQLIGKSIISSTVLIFVLSILAKLVGFVRSMLMASYFGAGLESDAFYLAQSLVSNVLYMITASIGVSFLPVYVRIREQKGRDEAREYTGETILLMSLFALALMFIVIAAAPLIIRLMAPEYEDAQRDDTILYLRIMALGIVFSLLTNIFTNLLNAEKTYGYSSILSILNTILLIVLLLVFGKRYGIMVAVIAVPLGGLLQFLVASLRSKKFFSARIKKNPWNPNTKILIVQALPILFSNATVEINQFVDKLLLVRIEDGAVTAVHYAGVLFQFASNLLSIPISTVMFTEFSEMVSKNDEEGIRRRLREAFHVILLLGIPVTIVMLFFTQPIIRIVYERGNYTEAAVLKTAAGLFFYAFCVIPTCLNQTLTKAFYAMEDTKTPMILSVLAVILNIGSSILLSIFMGLSGVVAGTAVSGITFAVVRLIVFSKKKISLHFHEDLGAYLKVLAAGVPAGLAAFFLGGQTKLSFFLFVLYVAIVFAVFFLLLLILKDRYVLLGIQKGKRFLAKLFRKPDGDGK